METQQNVSTAFAVMAFATTAATVAVAASMAATNDHINTTDADAKQAQSDVYAIIAIASVVILWALRHREPLGRMSWIPTILLIVPLALSVDIKYRRQQYITNTDSQCETLINGGGTKRRGPRVRAQHRIKCDAYAVENAEGKNLNVCHFKNPTGKNPVYGDTREGGLGCWARGGYIYDEPPINALITLSVLAFLFMLIGCATGASM